MFTNADKFLGSAIVSGLGFLSIMGWLPFDMTPDIEMKITAVCAALVPFIVWLIPNKPKA